MKFVICVCLLVLLCLDLSSSQKGKLLPVCNDSEEGSIRFYTNQTTDDNRTEGQVLVCEDGQWRRVCDKQWTEQDAQVACRELGFHDGENYTITHTMWDSELSLITTSIPVCGGTESAISQCVNETAVNSGCDSWAVGVICDKQPPTLTPSMTDTSTLPVSTHGQPPMASTSTVSQTPSAVPRPPTPSTSSTQQTHPTPPTSSPPSEKENNDSFLSTFELAMLGTGAILIILILVVILLLCICVTRRWRKTKVSISGATDEEISHGTEGEIHQLGWSNPLALKDQGHVYAELSTSLSPTTPQPDGVTPYVNHSLTPGSSVSGSSHDYEELHESVSKAMEYKRANSGDLSLPQTIPQLTVAPQEKLYSSLRMESAYQTLQPCMSTPDKKLPVLPPRSDGVYAHLDHGKGMTFKPSRTNHYPAAEDRTRSSSCSEFAHGRVSERGHAKVSSQKAASLDRSHQKIRRHHGRKAKNFVEQYGNLQSSSAVHANTQNINGLPETQPARRLSAISDV